MSLARHRDLLVLGAVRTHSIHGYALSEGLEQGLGKALGLKRPSVYACLARLETRGLIRHSVKRDSAYPERRVYEVTADGEAALPELLHASVRGRVQVTVPLAVVIAFLDLLDVDLRGALLRRCQDDLRAALEQLRVHPVHEGHAGLALRLLRRHCELDLAAVDELLAGLV